MRSAGGRPPRLRSREFRCVRRPSTTRRPRVGPVMTQNSGPTGSSTRTSSHGWSSSQAQSSMPTSRRRPPLPRRTSTAPRRASRSASASASASLIRKPARQSTAISPRSRRPCRSSPACAHDGDDLLDRRRIGRVAHALVAWRTPGVESGHRGRRSTAAGGIEQHLRHDALLEIGSNQRAPFRAVGAHGNQQSLPTAARYCWQAIAKAEA